MGIFFGTDGIRGKINENFGVKNARLLGNALSYSNKGIRIVIGKDTRKSCDALLLALSSSLVAGGVDVVSVGVCPTAGISYLTKEFCFDFGIVISASHNSAEFNGIKIFDKFGNKLTDEKEQIIESRFLKTPIVNYNEMGSFKEDFSLIDNYKDFLIKSTSRRLDGLKIALDMANGASCVVATAVFESLGASVISVGNNPNGENINKDCGATNIQTLQKFIKREKVDFGFAFDGDSDRIIAVDENGDIVDGDKIMYLFALFYKSQKRLKNNVVVGTQMTNMGVEKALRHAGIELVRTDIGDKYVSQKLNELSSFVGGEQSGHIFLKDKLPTGDGILSGVLIASICKGENKKLSSFFDFRLMNQEKIDILTSEKNIINKKEIKDFLKDKEKELKSQGRILVRASGTEPKIRIMVESYEKKLSKKIAKEIKKYIEKFIGEN